MLRAITPLLCLAACATPDRVSLHQLPLQTGAVVEASFGAQSAMALDVVGPAATRVHELEVVEVDGREHLVGRLDARLPFHHGARTLRLQAVDGSAAVIAESVGEAAEGTRTRIRRQRRSMRFSLPLPEASGTVRLRLRVGGAGAQPQTREESRTLPVAAS
ncbi:MAG: hypothetical protein O2816_16865 [Planctomycetota bacterium]|nr:hypothetical protein [Planctomycetota bacterium]